MGSLIVSCCQHNLFLISALLLHEPLRVKELSEYFLDPRDCSVDPLRSRDLFHGLLVVKKDCFCG